MLRACLALVIALVLASFLPGGHGAAPGGHPREEHQPLVQQQAQQQQLLQQQQQQQLQQQQQQQQEEEEEQEEAPLAHFFRFLLGSYDEGDGDPIISPQG